MTNDLHRSAADPNALVPQPSSAQKALVAITTCREGEGLRSIAVVSPLRSCACHC